MSEAKNERQWELCKELHALKTELFMKMIEDGPMPLRPGVKRPTPASSWSTPCVCLSRL